jgi:hypothetical protein
MAAELRGFWSYVRKDDKAVDGAITRLAEHVVEDYEMKRGDETIDLFLDTAKVKWGERWREKVREAIEGGAFFVPIVTPRFLSSEECRKEILEFAEQERELGREGLIMPLYFVEVAAVEAKDSGDPVVELLLENNREDWRERRLLDRSVQAYKKGVDKLVNRLIEVAVDGAEGPASSASDEDDGEYDDDGGPGGVAIGTGIALPAASEGGESPTAGPGGGGIDLLEVADSSEQQWTLDQLAEGEDAFPRIVETLSEIAKVLQAVGELSGSSTSGIEQSDQEGKGFKGRLAVANGLARQLDGPAETLKELTSQYTADLAVLDPAIKKMIEVVEEQYEEGPEDAEEFFTSIKSMVESSEGAAEQIAAMIKAMEFPAQFSRELNRPISSMRGSLQSMLDADEVIGAWRKRIEVVRGEHGG